MRSFIMLAALFLATISAAGAQVPGAPDRGERTPGGILDESGLEEAVESVMKDAGPQLEGALDALALSLSDIMTAIANDPELRRAALATAGGMIDTAQVLIQEQAEVLNEALRKIDERITTPRLLQPMWRAPALEPVGPIIA